MSQAHSSFYNTYSQDYQGYQQTVIPQYQQHTTPYPPSNALYNAQQPPVSPNPNTHQTPAQLAYAGNPRQSWSPQTFAQQVPTMTQSPIPPTPQTVPYAQQPSTPMAPPTIPAYFASNTTHQVRTYASPSSGSTPMQHSPVYVQNPYQNSITPSQARRPLPTPTAVQRPVTQPPPTRRPLPDPQASPSAPSSPFRHRPSLSVSASQSFSSFSTKPMQTRQMSDTAEARLLRPLPNPMPRSTKSLDLTRSLSPVNDIFNNSGPLPEPGQKFVPHWKRALPSAPDQQSGSQSTLSRTPSGLRPLPFPGQRQGPPAPVGPAAPALLPPSRPPMTERAYTTGTDVNALVANSFPIRDRSRTLPDALPAPTSALPRRPDSVIITKSQGSMIMNRIGVAESPISSESEDLHDIALLQRPPRSSPIAAPPRAPSPSPATVSRFIERSPERGRGPARDGKAPRRLSLVSRMAEMSMNESVLGNTMPSVKNQNAAPAITRTSTQPAPQWPADLPRLPLAPQARNGVGDQPGSSREPSPTRSQPSVQYHTTSIRYSAAPPSHGSDLVSRFPPPPQHPASPTRRLPSPNAAREVSPIHTEYEEQQRPPLPPRNNPSSPIRPRFSRQAPEREPALPAPRAQRIFPNLDDAPPPSLRRTPSPSPTRSSGYSTGSSPRHQQQNGTQALPNIRTQDVGSAFKMTSPSSAPTPNSASSAFSLSAFPIPPQQYPPNVSGISVGPASRKSSINAYAFPAGAEEDLRYDEPMGSGGSIAISGPTTPAISVNGVPDIAISVTEDQDDTMRMPMISVGGLNESPDFAPRQKLQQRNLGPLPAERSKRGLFCGGCGGTIIGRAVYTTDASWHPGCLKCTACGSLLENLAVCEHEGRPYCSLCYYEVSGILSLAIHRFEQYCSRSEFRTPLPPLSNRHCRPQLHHAEGRSVGRADISRAALFLCRVWRPLPSAQYSATELLGRGYLRHG